MASRGSPQPHLHQRAVDVEERLAEMPAFKRNEVGKSRDGRVWLGGMRWRRERRGAQGSAGDQDRDVE